MKGGDEMTKHPATKLRESDNSFNKIDNKPEGANYTTDGIIYFKCTNTAHYFSKTATVDEITSVEISKSYFDSLFHKAFSKIKNTKSNNLKNMLFNKAIIYAAYSQFSRECIEEFKELNGVEL